VVPDLIGRMLVRLNTHRTSGLATLFFHWFFFCLLYSLRFSIRSRCVQSLSQALRICKVSDPDGFPTEFYQHFWNIIKTDLLALFNEFHQGTLPLHRLNFDVITLLPKKVEATMIQQYRPICLLNLSFKIFTKVLTNRINLIAQKVIISSQTAFLPSRYL
jgi:hypothetical protein